MDSSEKTYLVDLSKSGTTYPFGVKLRRFIWQCVVKPVFLLLPRPFSPLRIQILRLFGARIGGKCLIEPGVDVLMPWNLRIAESVAIGRRVEIYNHTMVDIGTMSVVSQYSILCTSSHDYTHPHFPLVSRPIVVGSQCWVALDVFVGPGVKISDGAVIGARSVVTKDVPPWMVCAGTPCKPIKPRVLSQGEHSVAATQAIATE